MLRSYHRWAAFVPGETVALRGAMSRWAPSLNGFLLDFAKLSVVRGVVVAGDGVGSGAECCVEDAHAEGMVIAMQKNKKWSSGRYWTGIGVALAVDRCGARDQALGRTPGQGGARQCASVAATKTKYQIYALAADEPALRSRELNESFCFQRGDPR